MRKFMHKMFLYSHHRLLRTGPTDSRARGLRAEFDEPEEVFDGVSSSLVKPPRQS